MNEDKILRPAEAALSFVFHELGNLFNTLFLCAESTDSSNSEIESILESIRESVEKYKCIRDILIPDNQDYSLEKVEMIIKNYILISKRKVQFIKMENEQIGNLSPSQVKAIFYALVAIKALCTHKDTIKLDFSKSDSVQISVNKIVRGITYKEKIANQEKCLSDHYPIYILHCIAKDSGFLIKEDKSNDSTILNIQWK